MADFAQIDPADPPLAPPSPPLLNGSSEPPNLVLSNNDEGGGSMVNYPQSNGIEDKKSANQRMKKRSSSGDRRRSSRLIENPAGESAGKEANFPNLDVSTEKSPLLKKHKSGKKVSFFIGKPIPEDEARSRWPWRYEDSEVRECGLTH